MAVLIFNEGWDVWELECEIRRVTGEIVCTQKHLKRLETALTEKKQAQAEKIKAFAGKQP